MKYRSCIFGLAILVCTAVPGFAEASTIHDFGTIPDNATYTSGYSYNPGSGDFTNDYTFMTQARSHAAGSVTNSFTIDAEDIQNLMVALFSGTPTGTNSEIKFGMGSPTSPTSQQASVSGTGSAGDYFFRVTGNSLDNPNYSLSISITPSAVPLPASAPMFSAAVLALGVVGYGMKRKRTAAAA